MFELTKEAIVGFNKSIHIHLYFSQSVQQRLKIPIISSLFANSN